MGGGQIVQGTQYPRIFIQGHFGRGYIVPASAGVRGWCGQGNVGAVLVVHAGKNYSHYCTLYAVQCTAYSVQRRKTRLIGGNL